MPEWNRPAVDAAARAPDAQPEAVAGVVTMVSPRNNMRVIRNPELPADLASLPLKATVPAGATQVVWYVDGKPFLVGPADATARWPLQAGTHTFEARLPYRDSSRNR